MTPARPARRPGSVAAPLVREKQDLKSGTYAVPHNVSRFPTSQFVFVRRRVLRHRRFIGLSDFPEIDAHSQLTVVIKAPPVGYKKWSAEPLRRRSGTAVPCRAVPCRAVPCRVIR